jgi:hypothetical protein
VPQRKLPVSNGQPASGGFVTFPQGTFTADPASAVKADNVYGLSFDRAVAKWVPVPRSWVSPDGARYAYWEWQTPALPDADSGSAKSQRTWTASIAVRRGRFTQSDAEMTLDRYIS